MGSTVAETLGFIVQMTDILALPDSEGYSILVSLEFRNGTRLLVAILVSDLARMEHLHEHHLLRLAELLAKVEMTLPNASKLCNHSRRCGQHRADLWVTERTNPLLICSPPPVRSLAEVAFPEPVRSIRFCS